MRFRLPALARTISRPTAVDPVNATPATPGCSVIPAPAVSPNPVRMFTTPGGSPASSSSRPSQTLVSGVCSAGLSTQVLPQASAGASFHAASISG